jgi:chemotaxis protein methyltransferase WspC
MGLSSNSAIVVRAVNQRMSVIAVEDETEYLRYLHHSGAELKALVEQIAVFTSETWFFRNIRAFQGLQRFVLEKWLPDNPTGILRALSLPCSTGEEPYSIAMALTDIGMPKQRLHIDAVDIGELNLVIARRGVYGDNSFRGDDLSYRDRYFTHESCLYAVSDYIKSTVNFEQGDLLDPGFLIGREPYDVVFCRNLMVYFDGPTQDQACHILNRLVNQKGKLYNREANQMKARSAAQTGD